MMIPVYGAAIAFAAYEMIIIIIMEYLTNKGNKV